LCFQPADALFELPSFALDVILRRRTCCRRAHESVVRFLFLKPPRGTEVQTVFANRCSDRHRRAGNVGFVFGKAVFKA